MVENTPNSIAPDIRIARNRSGNWELRWTERDSNGRARTRTHSCRTTDRAIAEQVRSHFLSTMALARVVASGPVRIAEVIDAYLRGHVAANGVNVSQEWSLRPVRDWFGALAVEQLNDTEAQKYIAHRRAQGRADGTIRRELGALRAAMEWGRKQQVFPAGVQPLPFTLPPEGAPRRNTLSEDEAEKLWQAASARALDADLPFSYRRIGYFICLAMETAAREAAIRGLTIDRVDRRRERWLIDFRDPNMRVSRKRRVPLPVSARLEPVLADCLDPARRDGAAASSPHVLGHSGAVYKQFKRFTGELGLSLTIHDLRRTWATLRVSWGVPIEQVAAALGDTIETTERHYAHFAPGYLAGAVDARGPGAEGRV